MAIGRISGQMLKANLLRSGTDLAFETNLLVLDVTNSRIGIGTASPSRQLHISGTGAVRLPGGTSAQRGTPAAGDVRYNSDTGQIEGYTTDWFAMTGGSTLSDQDGNTGISVERNADENQIHFFTETSGDVAHIRDNGNIELNNLKIADKTISSLTTNGDITISPNGTGRTSIKNLTVTDGLDLGDLQALNVGEIQLDSISADNGTDFDLTLADNQATALEIKEGSNAYMTFVTTNSGEQITFDKKLVVSTGVTFQTDTADINGGNIDGTTIGANSAAAGTFTDVTATNVQATNIKANDGTAAITIANSTGAVNVSTNLSVDGNLTVNGTTTTIDSTTLTIEDPLIQLAKNNSGGDANTFDQGLFFNRGSLANVSFIWDESTDQFAFAVTAGEDGTTAGNITIDSYANIRANVITGADVETGTVSAADGTLSMTIASSTGVVTFNAGPSFGDNDITNVGDINVDSVSSDNGTDFDILLDDNSATALEIKEGSNAYMTFNTTDSSELITISKDTTMGAGTTLTAVTASVLGDITVQGSVIADTIVSAASNADISITPAGTGAVVLSKVDIAAGEIDGTTIGANSAAAATFTTLNTTGAVTFNDAGADVDFRVEGDNNANLLVVDASTDRIGIKTASPAYTLDIGSATDAIRVPVGDISQRPTGAVGVIRFNSENSTYEGSTDGSTYTAFQMAGDTPIISKVSATGDGSSSTFTGFFASTPNSVANVLVFIDNVYQEPTENYSVSGTNITFTSAPHSGARIFAIVGFDNTAAGTGGVLTTETASTNFTSAATDIMTFNATSFRSAEAFITTTDSANSEYEVAKALIVHDGTTAYVTVYGQISSTGSDLSTYSVTLSSGSVKLQAVSAGGQQSARVQYRLSTV